MTKTDALQAFEALSSGIRLDVFRMLVRAGTGGCVAGEISSVVGVPPTNLSFHLKVLTQSKLLSTEQEGRYQRYRANLPLMVELVAYLTENCCAGQGVDCLDLERLPKLDCSPRKA